jgi:hypothetical protein
MSGTPSRRRLDPCRAKMHRSYTIAEAAKLQDSHPNTVRRWIENGLDNFKVNGIVLILGEDLRAFLERKLSGRRSKCGLGSMYCLRCRAVRTPPPDLIEAISVTDALVNLRGICPECGSLVHRRAAVSRLAEIGFSGVTVKGG